MIGKIKRLKIININNFFIKKSGNLSQNIAHFGFSLFLLSVIFNNIFASEVITNLKVGDTYNGKDFKIYFEKLDQEKGKNFESLIGKFIIKNSNEDIQIMMPELRIYNQPSIVTSEAFIKSNLISDKFMTMNLVQNQSYFNIRYQIKPFMIWIWLSVIIIVIAGIISLLKKKK